MNSTQIKALKTLLDQKARSIYQRYEPRKPGRIRLLEEEYSQLDDEIRAWKSEAWRRQERVRQQVDELKDSIFARLLLGIASADAQAALAELDAFSPEDTGEGMDA